MCERECVCVREINSNKQNQTCFFIKMYLLIYIFINML